MKIPTFFLSLLAFASCTHCPTKPPQPIILKIILVHHLGGRPDLVLPMPIKPNSSARIMPPSPTRTR